MKLWEFKLSRRKLLALGGVTVATGWLERVSAQAQPETQVLRIGMVLPTPAGTAPATTYRLAANVAPSGAVMTAEELGFNAELVGQRLEVRIVTAPGTESAVQAAERLISVEEVFAFAGGYGDETALALSQLANERQVPFFNIGSASDALRGVSCNRYTFHVEASTAMYLDALTDWYVRSAFRRWFYVYPDTDGGCALYDRALSSLTERHFGAEQVGSAAVDPSKQEFSGVISDIGDAESDVVLLLTDPDTQLAFLGNYAGAGLSAKMTRSPDPTNQTHTFLGASRDSTAAAGVGYRASLRKAKIDAYGAKELSERFRDCWGMLMDGPAWAAYQSSRCFTSRRRLAAG